MLSLVFSLADREGTGGQNAIQHDGVIHRRIEIIQVKNILKDFMVIARHRVAKPTL
jgi:hypothetical protein